MCFFRNLSQNLCMSQSAVKFSAHNPHISHISHTHGQPQFPHFNRIQIQIIFRFRQSCEYENEYIQFIKTQRITNTNSIQFENFCRIRILLFGFKILNTIRIPSYLLTSAPCSTSDEAFNRSRNLTRTPCFTSFCSVLCLCVFYRWSLNFKNVFKSI